ncbi:hypothetical protein ABH915_002533 [Arthrobacter sp. MW3 TE3886]
MPAPPAQPSCGRQRTGCLVSALRLFPPTTPPLLALRVAPAPSGTATRCSASRQKHGGGEGSRYVRHPPRPNETEHHLMRTQTLIHAVTGDTAEAVTAPVLPTSKATPPRTGSGPRRPASQRSPPRCSSTGPPASPTAGTTSPPQPPNSRIRTASPTAAGPTKSRQVPPAKLSGELERHRHYLLTTSWRFLQIDAAQGRAGVKFQWTMAVVTGRSAGRNFWPIR